MASAERKAEQLGGGAAGFIAAALPMPVLLVDAADDILFVNPAAEQFFAMGAGLLARHPLSELLPFGSPLIQLMRQARERNATVAERDVDLTTPRTASASPTWRRRRWPSRKAPW